MLGIANGTAQWITATAPVPISNRIYNSIFGSGQLGPLPSLLLWLVIVAALGHLVLTKTPYGRQVLATGGNAAAARFSGINTQRIRFWYCSFPACSRHWAACCMPDGSTQADFRLAKAMSYP